jgi:hypothetical protein
MVTMTTRSSPIEIHFFLTNGLVKKFYYQDSQIIQTILDTIKPQKFFTQDFIIITSDTFHAYYPSQSVCRVDFVMENTPAWITMDKDWNILQISEEEFRQRYPLERKKLLQRGQSPSLDEPHHGFTKIELINSQKLFLEVQGKAKLKQERVFLIHKLFYAPTLYYKRKNNGVIFINPTKIVNMTFYPGPGVSPPTAFPTEPQSGIDIME